MSLKQRLIKRALKPFNELNEGIKKHGDIKTIASKVGGAIFYWGLGVPLDIGISLIAVAAIPVVSLFDSDTAPLPDDNKVDLSQTKCKIHKFVDLNKEKLYKGTRQDINYFFCFKEPFTKEQLKQRYEEVRIKYHPDKQKADRTLWDECEKLYSEMLWHWFKTDEEKVSSPFYPKLREKSFMHTPTFAVNQQIKVDNGSYIINGRVARQSSCPDDNYLIIDDSTFASYEIQESDLIAV